MSRGGPDMAIFRRTAVLVAVTAAGCGPGEEISGNAMDVAFVEDMTVHSQAAIELANMASKRARDPRIRQIAEDTIIARQSEITTLKRIAVQLHAARVSDGGHVPLSPRASVDMSRLRDATSFDRAFVKLMIRHHRGTAILVETHHAMGKHARLRAIATRIGDAQTEEIVRMRRWRDFRAGRQRVPRDGSSTGAAQP